MSVQPLPLRVLPLEDDLADARLFLASLGPSQSSGFEVVHVTRLAEALQRLAAGGFDAVVSDLNLPDSQGLETFRRLHQQAPGVPALILTGQADQTLAMRAVQAGAQDYLIKDSGDAVRVSQAIRYAVVRQQAINQQLQQAQASRQGCVVGLLGAKGGAGTTTVALNLAAVLAAQRHTVIAAEMWPGHGTFAEQTGQKPNLNLAQLLTLQPHQISAASASRCLVSLPFGPRVLYGPQKVKEFAPIDPELAQLVVKALAGLAEYVLLDLPSLASATNLALLKMCDLVLLVSEPDAASISAGRLALEMVRADGQAGALLGVLIVNRAGVAAGVPLESLKADLGCDLLGLVPPAADACALALKRGLPLVVAQPDHIAATPIVNLANRIVAVRAVFAAGH